MDQIRKRTRRGIGVKPNGQEYNLNSTPYTPEYARLKGASRSKVDLTFTGDMLENIRVTKVTDNGVTLEIDPSDYGKFRGAEEGIIRRIGQKKIKNGPKKLLKRPFFHLSDGDKEKIVNDSKFQGILKRAVKRLKKQK